MSPSGELERLQRWRMHLTDEVQDILEDIEALKREPLADDTNASPPRQSSRASLPEGTALHEAIDELTSEAGAAAALESAIDRPGWFGPIEPLILQATAYLDRLLDETERILSEADACQHSRTCRCQRQLQLFVEKIRPVLKEWEEFNAYAEALRKPRD
jgi:hypothetical protein